MALVCLVWIFFGKFQTAISYAIQHGKWTAEFGSAKGSLEPKQQDKPVAEGTPPNVDVPSASGPGPECPLGAQVVEEGATPQVPTPEQPKIEGMDPAIAQLVHEKIQLERERDAQAQIAWNNFYSWLELFLVPKTKAVLQWVAQHGFVPTGTFTAIVESKLGNGPDYTATVQALEQNGLLAFGLTGVQLGPNAPAYLEWRTRTNAIPILPLEAWPSPPAPTG